MASSKNKRANQQPIRPGSSTEDAKAFAGKGDFGVPESDVAERTYTSQNTRHSDPGGAQPRSGSDRSRTSGVGGNNSGVGSSSGGDLDTDVIGVGDGRGLAASGNIHEPEGPDDSTGGSGEFASGKTPKHEVPPLKCGKGSFVQPADDSTTAAQGADAASRPDSDDDAFVGEVSSSEATGRDDAGD